MNNLGRVKDENPQSSNPRFNSKCFPQSDLLANSLSEMFPEQAYENKTTQRAKDTLDEDIKNYVEAKRIVTKIAMDGHSLTEKELELLESSGKERLIEMVKKRVGGTSIDTYLAQVESLNDFLSKDKRFSNQKPKPLLM